MVSKLAVCYGCYMSSDFVPDPHTANEFTQNINFTKEEQDILNHLKEAWDLFVSLTGKHPDDNDDFRRAIHDAQKVIALRLTRRAAPDVFQTYE